MKAVIQRVKYSNVKIDGRVVGSCEKGFMILLGVFQGDTQADADKMIKKIPHLRIFEDENGKMNKGLRDVNGAILSVSQFTLYADTKHGNRPGFSQAASPEIAEPLYDLFNQKLAATGIPVETGHFGAMMKIDLENDGPTTIIYER